MPPKSAKALSEILKLQIDRYEKAFGEIEAPALEAERTKPEWKGIT